MLSNHPSSISPSRYTKGGYPLPPDSKNPKEKIPAFSRVTSNRAFKPES